VKITAEGTPSECAAFLVAAAAAGVGIRRAPDGTPVATDKSDVVMRLKITTTDPVPTGGATREPVATINYDTARLDTPGDGGIAFANDLDRLFKDFKRRMGRPIGEGP
jgi:hypothetical protein